MSDTRAPMEVRRVSTPTGSHIEPGRDSQWSELDQLAWKAGAVRADSGIVIHVTRTSPGRYMLSALKARGSRGLVDKTFVEAWNSLTDLGLGAEIARDCMTGEVL